MSLVVALPDQHQARRSARQELVRQVEFGATASEARRRCPVPMHRTTVYRLLKRVGQEGEQACSERRHGHPVKLRGEVLTWLLDSCQSHASVSSLELQHFQLPVTITRNATTIQVELAPFNDRALNRDLAYLCEWVNEASPHLPDGRHLSFTLRPTCCILAAQKASRIT